MLLHLRAKDCSLNSFPNVQDIYYYVHFGIETAKQNHIGPILFKNLTSRTTSEHYRGPSSRTTKFPLVLTSRTCLEINFTNVQSVTQSVYIRYPSFDIFIIVLDQATQLSTLKCVYQKPCLSTTDAGKPKRSSLKGA